MTSFIEWKVSDGGNGHLYGLTSAATDWVSAEAEAVAAGGHLVSINSQAEQTFLDNNFLSGANKYTLYWIGLSNAAPYSYTNWTTGEQVTYTNWKHGEPNNDGGNEHYIEMNWGYERGDVQLGGWNDSPLDGTRGYGSGTDGPYVGIIEIVPNRTLTALTPRPLRRAWDSRSRSPRPSATCLAGGATPNGGTVTFSDQNGAIDSATLVDGVATFTTSSLPAGTITVTASYGGTADFAPSTTGTIVTAAGNGTAGYTGDNGPATAAELNDPWGLAVDSAGDLFIADYGQQRDPRGRQGDRRHHHRRRQRHRRLQRRQRARDRRRAESAPAASPSTPRATCSSPTSDNNVIREVVKATGDIITVAGNGTAGYSGDNGPATAAELNSPRGVAVDSAGNLFIADNRQQRDPRGRQGDRRHHHRRRQRHRRLQRRQRARDRRRAERPQHRRRRLRGRPVHRRR